MSCSRAARLELPRQQRPIRRCGPLPLNGMYLTAPCFCGMASSGMSVMPTSAATIWRSVSMLVARKFVFSTAF